MMKYSLLFLLFMATFGCARGQEKKSQKTSILPISFTLQGQLRILENVGLLVPDIRFDIDSLEVVMTVGVTEKYGIAYKESTLPAYLKLFEISDFQHNEYYFNPYFEYMGIMNCKKNIDGKTYERKFSNYKRKDIPIEYLELDSAELIKFTFLSNHLNEIAISVLIDRVDKDSMIYATSVSEALKNPEKVYSLRLRNKKTTSLPPEVGKLKNLRVLDISGSWITKIPPEIEHCTNLKSLIANASRLTEIPSTIGNLKNLRNVNFGACKIKKLPEEFGQLESLWSLSLGSNQLSELPEGMAQLKNLQLFTIDKNNFTTFPKAVLGLESVSNLWMHGNDIQTIPEEIIQLKGLSHFSIDVPKIENLEKIRSLIPDVTIVNY